MTDDLHLLDRERLFGAFGVISFFIEKTPYNPYSYNSLSFFLFHPLFGLLITHNSMLSSKIFKERLSLKHNRFCNYAAHFTFTILSSFLAHASFSLFLLYYTISNIIIKITIPSIVIGLTEKL